MRARLCAVILAAVAVLADGCGTQQASTVTLSAAVANRGSYPDRGRGANATENAVLRASNGPDQRVHSKYRTAGQRALIKSPSHRLAAWPSWLRLGGQ